MPRDGTPKSSGREGSPDSPAPEDRKRIEAMLRAALDARIVVGELDSAALASDMLRTRAAVNCITEIGEAAAKLTAGGRVKVGSFPWKQIVGMRNIVVHVYWGIDLNEVVQTVRNDLPILIAALEQALAEWPLSKSSD